MNGAGQNALMQMADTERQVDQGPRNSLSMLPSKNQVFNALLSNAMEFVNAYQVPRDLGANIANAFVQAPGEIYKATDAHLSGKIPLTGERDREGAIHSFNALGNAGMALGPFAGRALQGVASTAKPASATTLYHGSQSNFDQFNPGSVFLTRDKDFAAKHAGKNRWWFKKHHPNVREAEVRGEIITKDNMLQMKKDGVIPANVNTFDDAAKWAEQNGYVGIENPTVNEVMIFDSSNAVLKPSNQGVASTAKPARSPRLY